MIKILHIGKYYAPIKGGIETATTVICSELAKSEDYSVKAIVFNITNDDIVSYIDNVEVIRCSVFAKISSQPLSLSYIYNIYKEIKNADIVHVHTPNPLAEFFTNLFIKKHQKLVVTHHSDVNKQSFLKNITYFFYKQILKRADSIIAPTKYHSLYSDIISNFNEKTSFIPYGIDPIKNEVKTNPRIKDYFLFVGRLVHYKGVDILIKAMTKTKEKLIIVGYGPHYESHLKLISELNLEDQITVYNHIESDSTLLQLYTNCKALVLPSTNKCENFGIVQLEAMRVKKPIIVSDLESGVRGVYEGFDCALTFINRDIDDLAKKINKLGQDELLRRRLGENGLIAFQNNFSTQKYVENHLDLYHKLLGSNKTADIKKAS